MMVTPNPHAREWRPGRRERGFTLVEVMVVVGIVAVLASLAIQQSDHYVARSRRVEAYVVLNAIHDAQLVYFGENDRFAGTFTDLAFSLDGGVLVSPTEIRGRIYTFALSQPWGPGSYYCMASANIDSDDWPDVLVITEGEPGG